MGLIEAGEIQKQAAVGRPGVGSPGEQLLGIRLPDQFRRLAVGADAPGQGHQAIAVSVEREDCFHL